MAMNRTIFYVLELPCPFRQTMSHFVRAARFDNYLCEGGQSLESGLVPHTNYSVTSPLTREFGCAKKFPWGRAEYASKAL
jgi:hypothetical protein